MTSRVLTPLQEAFLERFFHSETGRFFFLTGGTALAAYYFYHRYSADLDLFTTDDLALPAADLLMPRLAEHLACRILQARKAEFYRQWLLQPETGLPLRVDLVRDFGPQFGERRTVEGVVVDSVENIATNKITAILGRTEAKDFVDLYVILQAGYDFDDLFAKARQKDAGLQPFYFAGSLLQVQRLEHLPDMLKPISLEELRTFFLALADRLLDRINPDRNRAAPLL